MPLSHRLRNLSRFEIPLSRSGVGDVVMLGRYNYTNASDVLGEHRHPGCIEICYLEKGRQTYRLDNKNYRLKGGDVFISFPGEYHSSDKRPQEKGVLYWMIVRVLPVRTSFLGLSGNQGRPLAKSLLDLPIRHFRGSTEMKYHLDAIIQLYHDGKSPISSFAMTNHVGAFLLDVIKCAGDAKNPQKKSSFMAAFNYVKNNLDQKISIPHLAKLSSLSIPRFHVKFKQETGLPPGEYVLRAKIGEACNRLQSSRSDITQIALELGFSSSQHFATVFKQFIGHTPSAYRAQSSSFRKNPHPSPERCRKVGHRRDSDKYFLGQEI